MAGWNEAPTMPDVTEWLTSLTDADWNDWSTVDEATRVTVRKVAHRDSRTPLEYFDHLTAGGVSPTRAKALTEAWMETGGDQTTYTVTTAEPQQRPTEWVDRPKFVGLYRGGPRLAEAESIGRKVKTAKIDAETLGQQWFEMRRHG